MQPSIRKQQFSGTTEKGISLGHKKWGGLQCLDIYAQQGSGNLIQIAKAGRDNSHKGTLFKIAYLWWRYILGLEQCPLNKSETGDRIQYTNSIWFTEVCQFIQNNSIYIDVNIDWKKKERENDEYIMDLAVRHGFNLQKIKQINHSRLYLRAITISDLADEIGKHIKASCYDWSQATPIKTFWTHEYNFPKPNRQAWNIWIQFLKTLVTLED